MNTVTDQPIFPTAIRYGLIGGLIAIVWALVKNMSGLMTNSMAGIIDILVYGFIIYSAIKALRTAQGEHISFGKALGVGTIACALAGLLSGVFNFAYFNFIDPSAVETMVTYTTEMMEGFGMDEDALEAAAESARNGFTLPRLLLSGLGGGAFMGLIGSLIAGAIMKKEAPINV